MRAGIEPWIVGGALRDSLVGRAVRDVDLLVECRLEDVQRALPAAIRIEARHPIVALPQLRVEISVPRDGAEDASGDLWLRDFTVNAIAWEPHSRRWLDPTGGRRDLEERRLRAPRPGEAFRRDPLRILRGVRLAQALALESETETWQAMQREAPRLARAPGERLRSELWRILGLSRPSPALEALRSLGVLETLLPELVRGIGVKQNRYHPDDLYRHSLRVCDATPADPILRLAALLRDVGKPETQARSESGESFRFHGHKVAAAPLIERVGTRLRLSSEETARIGRLVRLSRPRSRDLESPAAIRRMVRRVGADILPGLLALRRADLASRKPVAGLLELWDDTVRRIRRIDEERRGNELAIGGDDVMECLGIAKGPEVGAWLERAQQWIGEDPRHNERSTLRGWLRRERDRVS